MKSLSEIYKKPFFGKRHRLSWRAPHVCDAIVHTFNLKKKDSIIDVGCGIGDYVAEFIKRGFLSWGVEGSPEATDFFATPNISVMDVRRVGVFHRSGYTVCMSLEVAEHIESEYSEVYVDNLSKLSDQILITAAPPGQGGHYHVNCQPKEYWEEKFSIHGYQRDRSLELKFNTRFSSSVRFKKEIAVYINNVIVFTR